MKEPLGSSRISNVLLSDTRPFYEWKEFIKPLYEGGIIIEAGQLLRAGHQFGVKIKTKDRKLKMTISEVYFISL